MDRNADVYVRSKDGRAAGGGLKLDAGISALLSGIAGIIDEADDERIRRAPVMDGADAG